MVDRPGTNMSEKVISFFRGELFDDEITTTSRVQSIKRIKLVAASLPPPRVRTDLVEILQEAVQKYPHEDELLFSIAEQIPSLIQYLGGGEFVNRVIPILASITSTEETFVRKQAVKSLIAVVESVTPPTVRIEFTKEHIIPVFEKLAKATWFPSRVSACDLFVTTYKYSPESCHYELNRLYTALCHDDIPIVRMAAADALEGVFQWLGSKSIINTLLPCNDSEESIFHFFWADQAHEHVRCKAMASLVVLVTASQSSNLIDFAMRRIIIATSDLSWKVRMSVAKSVDLLVASSAVQQDKGLSIGSVLSALMTDPVQEVRTTTLIQLAKCKDARSGSVIEQHVLPDLQRLASDEADSVREALASSISVFATTAGAQATQKFIVPLMELLMKDEAHNVRLKALQSVGDLAPTIGADPIAKTLLPPMQSLMTDHQWRIRYAITEQIPKLAKQFGLVSYTTALQPLLFAALTDSVNAVRECAMRSAAALTTMFGSNWMTSNLLPQILDQAIGAGEGFAVFQATADSTARRTVLNGRGRPVSYLSRITVLRTLQHVATSTAVKVAIIEEFLIPHLITCFQDPVPNVRFAAIRIFMALYAANLISKTYAKHSILSCIQTMLYDEDLDVRYFAATALDAAGV